MHLQAVLFVLLEQVYEQQKQKIASAAEPQAPGSSALITLTTPQVVEVELGDGKSNTKHDTVAWC